MGARVDTAVVEVAVTTPEEATEVTGGTVDDMGGRWTTTERYHEQKRGGQSDSADA
jgi:hypothetical protein